MKKRITMIFYESFHGFNQIWSKRVFVVWLVNELLFVVFKIIGGVL